MSVSSLSEAAAAGEKNIPAAQRRIKQNESEYLRTRKETSEKMLMRFRMLPPGFKLFSLTFLFRTEAWLHLCHS
jgi:hypothetical protein